MRTSALALPTMRPDEEIQLIPRLGDAPGLQVLVANRFALGVAANVFQPRPHGPDADSAVALLFNVLNRRTLGFATFFEVNDDRLWIDLLWVEPAVRRRGHALLLLAYVEGVAIERGLKAVLLGRSPDNAAMTAVLDRAGWPIDHVVHSRKIRT